jgi:hypothetical protein
MEIKKTLHDIFAFNSNSPKIEHIYKKYKKKKKKTKCEGATNKSMKPQIFLKFYVIEKGFVWSNIKLEWA